METITIDTDKFQVVPKKRQYNRLFKVHGRKFKDVSCGICGKTYHNKWSEFVDHMISEHKDNMFKCKDCDKVFLRKIDASHKKHYLYDLEQKRLQCFQDDNDKHKDDKKCPVCKFHEFNNSSLNETSCCRRRACGYCICQMKNSKCFFCGYVHKSLIISPMICQICMNECKEPKQLYCCKNYVCKDCRTKICDSKCFFCRKIYNIKKNKKNEEDLLANYVREEEKDQLQKSLKIHTDDVALLKKQLDEINKQYKNNDDLITIVDFNQVKEEKKEYVVRKINILIKDYQKNIDSIILSLKQYN